MIRQSLKHKHTHCSVTKIICYHTSLLFLPPLSFYIFLSLLYTQLCACLFYVVADGTHGGVYDDGVNQEHLE